ncbi:hypothetical protein Pisl_1311 [Pyrobaculum islandicum DSM 4184]|uniref:Uncharacterized protein n=1 Tax=Pyrobaculum islandicum (strain DSM 4184 / JCM 9189 / GEO3) TaxID=384616 RepID=A1RU42_PYRIL|nr:hypothetical protein Pisl_1311 [Pyrobaculum islandicum DSM 4184]
MPTGARGEPDMTRLPALKVGFLLAHAFMGIHDASGVGSLGMGPGGTRPSSSTSSVFLSMFTTVAISLQKFFNNYEVQKLSWGGR